MLGRLTRPVFYIYDNKISYDTPIAKEKLETGELHWSECISGFGKKKIDIQKNKCQIFDPNTLYEFGADPKQLRDNAAIVTYLDVQEEEGALISKEELTPLTTHVEIHPSLILGIMANMIAFPENNPLPRNLFSCGQSKQAVSLFHTNYQNRIDKMAVVLNYGQIPIVKSRYLKIVTNEEHPYGENAIVAIACFTGFNVEDAVIFNRASLDRGIFRTTYFTMYEGHEESSKVGDTIIDSKFCNVEDENVVGLKPGFDYSHLDEHGLIKENTSINDKTILIGKCMNSLTAGNTMIDMSKGPKKGQLGMVDKSFMTEGEEGYRLAKIRIREERIPAMGDKFSSRVGQKGTIGLILEEEDMPFTADGMRPDIIVNPHAMPSRMTIGQLIESLMGKACILYGGFGDCTAWVNKGPKDKKFGKMLTRQGFHSSGTEVLYNGMTGEQLEASIYMGPTYYMRLKHMVKDKINYRTRGPRTALTRQTVGGRANDGGLRIGEMDRDVIIAHGMSGFLNESFLARGDEFYVAICNKTGTIAIYNESKDIFLSPMADGPIKFVTNKDESLNIVNISRFGRSFSIIRVPYAFKLLYQELQAMNIQMRIITDANVDQLTSLKKGDDVRKLTGWETIQQVSAETRKQLGKTKPIKRPRRPPKKERQKVPPPKTAGPFAPPDAQPPPPGTVNPFAPPGTVNPFAPPGTVNPFAPPGAVIVPSEEEQSAQREEEKSEYIPTPEGEEYQSEEYMAPSDSPPTKLRDIVVPEGKNPGDMLLVDIGDDTQVEIEIPQGVAEGDILQFEIPSVESEEETLETGDPPKTPELPPDSKSPFFNLLTTIEPDKTEEEEEGGDTKKIN